MNFKLRNFIVFFIMTFLMFAYLSPVFANQKEPEITSKAAILVDNYTGTILYGKNIDEKLYPASITKILTAIVAIENGNLDTVATASYNAVMTVPSGYSIAAIQIGEELTVRQLLEVLMVHSANDAANILAEHVGGSIESFATMMNTKATEIGCKNTNFVNASGKHADNHYTTAKDLALIMQYCMKNDIFREISSMRSCKLPTTNKSDAKTFRTTVEILIPNNKTGDSNYYYPYAIAGKTGFTTQAQNCLVSVSKKDDLELTSVLLGAGHSDAGLSYRFIETKVIYNYGFDNYLIKKLRSKDDIIDKIDVKDATTKTKNLNLLLSEDINVLAKKDDNISSIKPELKLNNDIKAPVSQNQTLGTVTYNINGVGYTTNLIAANNVDKFNIVFFIFIGIVFLLILILFNILRKLRRR